MNETQRARWVALREITQILANVGIGNGIDFAHNCNPYMDEKFRSRVDREIESIRWQLHKRLDKLDEMLAQGEMK